MKKSSLTQGVIILTVSFFFAFSYNAIRSDGLDWIAVKEIAASTDVSDIDSLLAQETFFSEPMMIDLELAKKLFDRGVIFVDARDEEEFHSGHIAGALNLPLIQLASTLSPDEPMIVYCSGEGCNLSLDLAETLMLDWGFTKVFVFDGGWPEWKFRDYPSEEVN